MSTRAELKTLLTLAPEIDTNVISDANQSLLFDKAQIDLELRGRALPKNEKVNVVANQAEYVISGVSPVLTDNDFVSLDMAEGGVLFSDGTNWIGPDRGFVPKTREWLDLNQPGWRTASSAATPLYWYTGPGTDGSSNQVIGLHNKPSTARTDGLWIHYLSRGKLMTADTHYPWTGSTTQLIHLEPYEMLLVYWVLEFILRNISKRITEADEYLKLYLAGAAAMASRAPLADAYRKEAMLSGAAFRSSGGRRY